MPDSSVSTTCSVPATLTAAPITGSPVSCSVSLPRTARVVGASGVGGAALVGSSATLIDPAPASAGTELAA